MLNGATALLTSYEAIGGSGDVDESSLALVAPDGTESSPTTTVGDDRKVSAAVGVDQPGVWLGTWAAATSYPGTPASPGDPDADPPVEPTPEGDPTPGPLFLERDVWPSTFTDVWATTRNVMGASASLLTERKFNSLIGPLMACVLEDYADEVPSYAALSLGEGIMFDAALAFMAAAFLRPSVAPGTAQQEVAAVTTGPDGVKYFRRYQPIASDPVDEWLARAWQLLLCLPGFSTFSALGAGGVFVAAGRRKAIRRTLGLVEPAVPLYSLYSDLRIGYDYRSDLFVLTSP